MNEDARKYVAKYVEDMHSLLTHGLQPLAAQLKETQMEDHPQAYSFVQDAHRTLEGHVARLEGRLEALGTSPTTGIQDAASAVAGMVAGIYNHLRTEAVSKSVRDDYTFLSHCSVAYLMLLTTARSLGDHATEELAEAGYRDCARLVMEIDRFLPALVVQELKDDKLPATDVAGWARGIVHGAWNRQAAGAGPVG
jgi:hypothetical protein